MKVRIFRIAVIASALCLAPWAARAESVTITLPAITGAPGSTVDVMGTITNSGLDVLSLDGDSLSVSAPLTANDMFLNNAPFTLNGGSSDTFEFFQIIIAPDALLGIYGTDNSDVFSFFGASITDNVNFTVDVTGATPTPEPTSILLFASGLASLGLSRRRATTKIWPRNKPLTQGFCRHRQHFWNCGLARFSIQPRSTCEPTRHAADSEFHDGWGTRYRAISDRGRESEQFKAAGRIPCQAAQPAFAAGPLICRKHDWNASSQCSRSRKAFPRSPGCSYLPLSVPGSPTLAA
jgi:hypothetical protein